MKNQPVLKKGVLPHKFFCQPARNSSNSNNRNGKRQAQAASKDSISQETRSTVVIEKTIQTSNKIQPKFYTTGTQTDFTMENVKELEFRLSEELITPAKMWYSNDCSTDPLNNPTTDEDSISLENVSVLESFDESCGSNE